MKHPKGVVTAGPQQNKKTPKFLLHRNAHFSFGSTVGTAQYKTDTSLWVAFPLCFSNGTTFPFYHNIQQQPPLSLHRQHYHALLDAHSILSVGVKHVQGCTVGAGSV